MIMWVGWWLMGFGIRSRLLPLKSSLATNFFDNRTLRCRFLISLLFSSASAKIFRSQNWLRLARLLTIRPPKRTDLLWYLILAIEYSMFLHRLGVWFQDCKEELTKVTKCQYSNFRKYAQPSFLPLICPSFFWGQFSQNSLVGDAIHAKRGWYLWYITAIFFGFSAKF